MNDLCELFPEVSKQIHISANNIKILENNMKFFQLKNNNVRKTDEEINKRINDIEEKMKDMNILGMFKGLSGDDGDNTNIIKLINNLDEKFTGKINLIEEKLKKIEETNYKTNKDVVRVLNTFDLNKRNQEHMKENIESIELRLDSLQKDTDSKFGEINTKYDPKLNTIENSIEELNKKSENNSNLNNKGEIVQQNKEEEKQNLKITLENKDKIKELTEHLSELDKFIKSYVQKSGVDQIKNDISSLKTAVWNCSTLDDIKETKEREEELQKQISVLKENIDDLNANQIDHDDYNGYKRKVESLLNRMNDLDTTFTELLNRKNISLEKNKKHQEANKFLEIKKFEEFKTQIIKEFSNVNDNFNLLRSLTDKLSDTLNTKTSFDDFKALEEDYDAKLEDLRLTFLKKYADRVDTNKNIKFLDQQIKNIIQYYIKKSEKETNNWLIAKKPLNSNLCASCDSYIGDLKENSNFVPWNKYPNRENEKLYRLGNGFSKMLQLVQVDENDKKNVGVNSYESKNTQNEINDKGLPKIKHNYNQTKSYFYTHTNINNLNMDEDENNKKNKKEKDDGTQPKITKIYRMNKDNEKV